MSLLILQIIQSPVIQINTAKNPCHSIPPDRSHNLSKTMVAYYTSVISSMTIIASSHPYLTSDILLWFL